MATAAGTLAPAGTEGLAARVVAAMRAHPLALIMMLALALRLALLITPRSYFPDEIFQYLEAAHRLAFGPGVVPWEYRFGIRSWLLPLFLTGPMMLGGWLAPAGGAYLLLPRIALVLVSLVSVVAAAAIGRRISPRHGLFAAFAVAIWSEAALFGTQALTEATAVAPILAGAALLEGSRQDACRIVLGGALLALGIVLRFQYGPAVAVLGAIACGRDRRRWALAAAGGVAVVVASGALDVAMGQWPFGWIVENFHQNIGLKRSHAWTQGPYFYPVMIVWAFGFTMVPLCVLARNVVARFPALTACAIVNIAVHSLIAHKEYRYVLLSTTILVLLAGIGSIDAIDAAKRRWGRKALWLPVAVAGWVAMSASAYAVGIPARYWNRVTPQLQAFAALRAVPDLCGVAIVGDDWSNSGGYAWLHRDVPIYIPDDTMAAPASWVPAAMPGFDAIMAPGLLAGTLPPAYRETVCFGDGASCLFQRRGGCDPRAAARHEINRVFVRLDR